VQSDYRTDNVIAEVILGLNNVVNASAESQFSTTELTKQQTMQNSVRKGLSSATPSGVNTQV
jgi:hypothetical protein